MMANREEEEKARLEALGKDLQGLWKDIYGLEMDDEKLAALLQKKAEIMKMEAPKEGAIVAKIYGYYAKKTGWTRFLGWLSEAPVNKALKRVKFGLRTVHGSIKKLFGWIGNILGGVPKGLPKMMEQYKEAQEKSMRAFEADIRKQYKETHTYKIRLEEVKQVVEKQADLAKEYLDFLVEQLAGIKVVLGELQRQIDDETKEERDAIKAWEDMQKADQEIEAVERTEGE